MAIINNVWARQILDSRGIPTVESYVQLDTGHVFRASAPSGSTSGKYEALEIRDNNADRFFGMEVGTAISNVNQLISPAIAGMDPTNQADIDQKLLEIDGTKNRSKLGSNATLTVSIAVCKAGAAIYNLHVFDYLRKKYGLSDSSSKFPIPIVNVINGGKHGAGNLDFQEFHIIPTSTKPYPEALRMVVELYHELEQALIQMNAIHSVGLEGGFAPNLFTNKDALEIIMESIRRTDYQYGKDVFLGMDCSANHFFTDGKYQIKDRPKAINADELLSYYKELQENISLLSIEDPFIDDDWKSWNKITAEMGHNTMIIGDDFLASNKERLTKAIAEKSCSAMSIKPNQAGTISEAVDLAKMAKEANLSIIVSHRSGETNDDFLADFAIGIGAMYAKFGAPSRGERTAKYNRLLEIYDLHNST